jgi:hypothetical protein
MRKFAEVPMEARKPSPLVLASITLAAVLAVLLITTTAAYAQGPGNRKAEISVPITGTATPEGGSPVSLSGTFTVHRFERASDPSNPDLKIAAVGTLVATLPATEAGPGRTIVTQVALPLVTGTTTGADGGCGETVEMQCEILNLVLGPLDLNLLGLRIELNQLILLITAIPGALLGDLLCAISGLLSGGLLGDLVGQVLGLLNTLLGALG